MSTRLSAQELEKQVRGKNKRRGESENNSDFHNFPELNRY